MVITICNLIKSSCVFSSRGAEESRGSELWFLLYPGGVGRGGGFGRGLGVGAALGVGVDAGTVKLYTLLSPAMYMRP